ncbi:MAG: phosphomethylpyrimidine synthase ThiC, partial [Chitinivibrionales bacterium]|nr:phosphomethylpyrimidine synthase ThiC [Chitinivibrionales bacterium]
MIAPTRMKRAQQGIISDEVRAAAAEESLNPEILRAAIADGTAVLVRNKNRRIKPLALGGLTRVKINANIGTSSAAASIDAEL